jgi:hypothetical protein
MYTGNIIFGYIRLLVTMRIVVVRSAGVEGMLILMFSTVTIRNCMCPFLFIFFQNMEGGRGGGAGARELMSLPVTIHNCIHLQT